MKFIVTCIVSEEMSHPMLGITGMIQHRVNETPGMPQLGDTIGQVTVFLICSGDLNRDRLRERKYSKFGSFKHSISGEKIKDLSIGIAIPASCISGTVPAAAKSVLENIRIRLEDLELKAPSPLTWDRTRSVLVEFFTRLQSKL